MEILHFLPWCRLDREYVVNRVVFSPLDANQLSSIDVSVRTDAADELRRSIDITGGPVTRVTLFHLAKKGLLSEFSEHSDIEEYVEALDLLCFSALSRRDFLGRMDRTRLGGQDTVKFGILIEEAASTGATISMPNCEDAYCNADCFQPYALPLSAYQTLTRHPSALIVATVTSFSLFQEFDKADRSSAREFIDRTTRSDSAR